MTPGALVPAGGTTFGGKKERERVNKGTVELIGRCATKLQDGQNALVRITNFGWNR